MKWIQAEIADGYPIAEGRKRKIGVWYLFPDREDGTNDRAKLGYIADTGSKGSSRFLAYRSTPDDTIPLPGGSYTVEEAKAKLWAVYEEREEYEMQRRPIPKFIGYMGQSGHGSDWDTYSSRTEARAALRTFANGPCVVPELCHLDLYEIGDWEMIQSAKEMEETGNPFDCMDVRYEVEVREDFTLKIVKA